MNHSKFRLLITLAIVLSNLLFSQSGFSDSPSPNERISFTDSVQPILVKKCGKCHSETVQKGELDLSSEATIHRGGESGEPGITEALEESMLWLMIDGGGMPPEDEPQLTETEKSILRAWIEQEAKRERVHTEKSVEVHQHDVLPIILLRCTACHGAQRKDGGLDLRTVTKMQKGGRSGPALIKGDPENSLILQRIQSEACPPSELLLKFFVKRPPDSEVEILRDWIEHGAPVKDISPDVAGSQPDPLVTDEDREHWSFQPLNFSGERKSIDEFITEKLSEVGLQHSDEASREILIRRVYLDLTGLPPSLEDLNHWSRHTKLDWYSEMVEALLASPRYGERWGRYWLDLAGYADSEGGVSADPLREVAWKYRDYVIRSFNNDKPYDQFLLEQIAGDELVDYENAPEITNEIVDNLIATGFLRMGIDQTGSRTMNFVPERLGVIDDALNILGSSVMGLTIECARCHTHKYDAIPHRDYYRMKAIFQGALDEHDWLTFKNRKLSIGTPEHRALVAKVNPPLIKKLKRLQLELNQAVVDWQLELLRQHHPDQSEGDRAETIRALKIADNNRTLPQRILVEKLQKAEIIPNEAHPDSVQAANLIIAEIEQKIKDVKAQMEHPLTIRALWDRGEPSPTYIYQRGEHNKPGRLVGPGVFSVLTDGQTPFHYESPFPNGASKTGRRLAFARWLTDPSHPLTARVMVNRIWYHHFGAGLVESLENFGVQGAKPTHPELLDWLADQFITSGWSIKQMHRLIMNSKTYRQSSFVHQAHLKKDPQNKLLSRMPLKRLNAEAMRDSLLFVSGRLDSTMYGPPDTVSTDREGEVSVDPTSGGNWRRSIYIQYRRTEIPSMMETFDYPEMGPNCVSRNTSIVSPQSLMLLNNSRVRDLAASLAERVLTQTQNESTERKIRLIYQFALSRNPSDEELQVATESINNLYAHFLNDDHSIWTVYCHAILNSASFAYVD